MALVVGALVVALAVGWFGATAWASEGSAPRPADATFVVQPGDTLWSVARQLRPDADPRATILEIEQANGLVDSALRPGQRLVLPVAR